MCHCFVAAAKVLIRMIRVLGHPSAASQDSHATGLLEGPHYTRPADYCGWRVPDILLSGNHAQIAAWRRRESLRRTLQMRPDLLARAELTVEDREYLRSLGWSGQGAQQE